MTTVNETQSGRMLVVFLRDDDKIGVCYDAKKFEIDTDGKFAHGVRISEMKLGQFLPFPKLLPTLNDALIAVGLDPILEDSPKPVIHYIPQGSQNAVFDYYENNNQPEENKQFVKVNCFSHSRIATPVEETPQNVNSFCTYQLINDRGEIVVSMADTIGGFHPNFFNPKLREYRGDSYYEWVDKWARNFRPFGVFAGYLDRANNHFENYNIPLREGNYTFRFQNYSSVKQTVQAGFIRASNGTGDVNEVVEGFGTIERTLRIFPQADKFDDYKINANNYLV